MADPNRPRSRGAAWWGGWSRTTRTPVPPVPVPVDADVLAVDGDPLADPTALHRIVAVYLRGQRLFR